MVKAKSLWIGLVLIAGLLAAAWAVSEGAEVDSLEDQVGRILENQQKIILTLEEVKKELQVIKIRASLK